MKELGRDVDGRGPGLNWLSRSIDLECDVSITFIIFVFAGVHPRQSVVHIRGSRICGFASPGSLTSLTPMINIPNQRGLLAAFREEYVCKINIQQNLNISESHFISILNSSNVDTIIKTGIFISKVCN
jgi:hypothetical protein